MHKVLKSLLRNPGTGGRRGSRSTAEWDSVYTAEGLKERGVPRGGSGVWSGPEAEAAVRDLSGSGRRGDERSPREWQRRTAWEAGGRRGEA
jgi:hypothetical protein